MSAASSGRARLVATTALIFCTGCVSVTFIPTAATLPARAADCDIEVFSAGPPSRPYREIGILEGEGTLWQADLADVLPKLREEACLAGGDAIILISAQVVARGGEDDLDEELRAFATVIRWEPGFEPSSP